MPKAMILIDNSNIHVGVKSNYDDQQARFDFIKLEKSFYGEYELVYKFVAGSTPPASSSFWETMEREGYEVKHYERKDDHRGGKTEKGVDGLLCTKGAVNLEKHKPDVLVLLSGDLDMRSLVEEAKEHKCAVHMWAFEDSLSRDMELLCDDTFRIDDYADDLIYFQREDAREMLADRNARLENERSNNALEQRIRELERELERERRKKTSPYVDIDLKGVPVEVPYDDDILVVDDILVDDGIPVEISYDDDIPAEITNETGEEKMSLGEKIVLGAFIVGALGACILRALFLPDPDDDY